MAWHWLVTILRPFGFWGKRRLLEVLVPSRGSRWATIFGVRVQLDLKDIIQRWIYLGCFEPEETAVTRRLLRPGMTFVDVGANVGYFTWLAANSVGATGRVVAVEPAPMVFHQLAGTIRANGLSQVSLQPVGLSNVPGYLPLFVPPTNQGNNSPTMVSAEGWTQVEVPVTTLDTLLESQNIGHVDLLKLDVEGHEDRVLAGAMRCLAEGRIRAVLCEFNDYWLRHSGSSPAQLWARLVKAGLRPVAPVGNQPHFPPGCIITLLFTLSGESRIEEFRAHRSG